MRPSFSNCSFESGWDSSPQSFDSSYLNSHQFPQDGASVSPVVPSAVPFQPSNSFGTWADEQSFDNMPMTLSEQDLGFDSNPMFNNGPEASYGQEGSDLSGSFGSTGGYEAPHETSQKGPSSYSCPLPNAPAQQLTKNSARAGYQCNVLGCRSKTRFTRKTDLQRHIRSLHHGAKFDCEYKWCGREADNGFTRKDHYLEHLREMHRLRIPKVPRKRSKH